MTIPRPWRWLWVFLVLLLPCLGIFYHLPSFLAMAFSPSSDTWSRFTTALSQEGTGGDEQLGLMSVHLQGIWYSGSVPPFAILYPEGGSAQAYREGESCGLVRVQKILPDGVWVVYEGRKHWLPLL